MIHYHGLPITTDADAARIMNGRHAFISFARPEQVGLAAEICQSFAFDNGRFSAWKRDADIDIGAYHDFVSTWYRHPGFDWCVIPDVIDGDEQENDKEIEMWLASRCDAAERYSVPVWHLHESLDRLKALTWWPRVALGSSGQYAEIGTPSWWNRMAEAMSVLCDEVGRPVTKIHGLRMLDQDLRCFPFASADSTNVARNIGIDSKWTGAYQPPSKASRGIVLAERIEAMQSAPAWAKTMIQKGLFA